MDRPRITSWDRASPVQPDHLECAELRYAVRHAPHPGLCFRCPVPGGDGTPEAVEVAYFERTQRAGVWWKDAVWWLNGASPEEVVGRWATGDGRRTPSRRRLSRAEASVAER